MIKSNILIVDDEQAQRLILKGFLETNGYQVFESPDGKTAIEIVTKNIIDIILTDYKMPDITGIELLSRVKGINPEISVVIITAFGTIELAVKAMKAGAYDYITKPVDLDELEITLEKIRERQFLIAENKMLHEQLIDKYRPKEIIAKSKQMEEILSIVARVADSKAAVLVTGESGTGKELVAKAIHYAGSRKHKPFVAVNCAALNENLLESELFGHERGSFTGADKQRAGRFETADGGSIFLDEIGDIPVSTQVKLLRVLQEGNFERVGSSETINTDVRIIAATNKNIKELILSGKFREDLYYRLNVVSIEIPPLRERREDILPMIEFYLKKFTPEMAGEMPQLSKEALDYMLKYEYPGNVRELENILHRAIVLSRNGIITRKEISSELSIEELSISKTGLSLIEQMEHIEKKLVKDALNESNGNKSQAARKLCIQESSLRYRLNKWGMK